MMMSKGATDEKDAGLKKVVSAAKTGIEAAMRTLRPGKRCSDVTDMLQRIADAYGVKLVEGVLTHQMKRFVIDGNKVVLSVPGPDTRVEDAEFEEFEVYAVDVVMSSGEVRQCTTVPCVDVFSF